jgi:tetratricopeptide (TPR) repeat protein
MEPSDLQALETRLAADPQNIDLLTQTARAYAEDGLLEKAVSTATKVILLGADGGKIRALRGRCLARQGNSAGAREDYEAACALEPLNTAYMIGISNAVYGNWQEMLAQTTKVLLLEPDNAEALLLRGSAYSGLEQYGQAVRDIQRLVEVTNGEAWTYGKLAEIYLQAENTAGARNALETALRLEPEAYSFHRQFLQVAAAENNYPEVIDHCTAMLRERRDDTYALSLRSMAYQALGDNTRALQDLQACLAIDPDDEEIRQQIAELNYDDILENEFDAMPPQARDSYGKARELCAVDGAARREFVQALALLDRAVQTANGKFPRAHTLKSRIYNELNEIDKCMTEAQTALAESPNEFEAQWVIVSLYIANHQNRLQHRGGFHSMVDDVAGSATSTGGSIIGGLFRHGAQIAHESKVNKELRTEIDKLLAIYKRLTDHGVYDFRYIDFSDYLLEIATQIHDKHLPYEKRTIIQAIIGVAPEKIYLRDEENQEQIDKTRLSAQGEMQR